MQPYSIIIAIIPVGLKRQVFRPRISRNRLILYVLFLQALINEEQWMCHKCWVAASRHQIQQQDNDNIEIAQPAGPSSMSITGYRRAPNTSRSCMFPNCRRQNLLRIPQFIRMRMLSANKLYIPLSARVCNEQLYGNSWAD